MSPQAKQVTKEQTAAEKRAEEIERDAREHVKAYKPTENEAAFNGARGYVEAQFALAEDLKARWDAMLAEREVSRESIRGLYTQGLLTPDEAVTAFIVYPYRPPNRGKKATDNGQDQG